MKFWSFLKRTTKTLSRCQRVGASWKARWTTLGARHKKISMMCHAPLEYEINTLLLNKQISLYFAWFGLEPIVWTGNPKGDLETGLRDWSGQSLSSKTDLTSLGSTQEPWNQLWYQAIGLGMCDEAHVSDRLNISDYRATGSSSLRRWSRSFKVGEETGGSHSAMNLGVVTVNFLDCLESGGDKESSSANL